MTSGAGDRPPHRGLPRHMTMVMIGAESPHQPLFKIKTAYLISADHVS
jgi:hypothetical protein